jgi:virginiamycin B lyase
MSTPPLKRLECSARPAALLLILCARAMAQSGTYSDMTEYPVPTPNSFPAMITAGPDGALWFTETQGNQIGRITATGVVTEYPVPTPSSHPYGITAGPDGALWFAEGGDGSISGKIGRITTAGVITEYGVPTANSGPLGITAGPDGALWFTEKDGNNIGRITTAGAVSEYAAAFNPWGITAGPDGALWFTEYQGNQIGRITTAGIITEYIVVPGSPTQTYPQWITAGPDGALWFTLRIGIGRITTAGIITRLYVVGGGPNGITAGPDGALWFAGFADNAIGRITTTGVITQYPVHVGRNPNWIAAGPDGALWFTESYGASSGGPPLVGRAPACGLGFSARFSNTALTMNFNLGINTPATFSIHLRNATGPVGDIFAEAIPAFVPPQAFTLTSHSFPNLGAVTIVGQLNTAQGKSLCAEWTTVNTAP